MNVKEVVVGMLVDVHGSNSEVMCRGTIESEPRFDGSDPMCWVLVTETFKPASYKVGTKYEWFVFRFKAVGPPPPTNCTCDIKVLLWGTQGCTCGWLEVERKNGIGATT